jgi:hypothetical protein
MLEAGAPQTPRDREVAAGHELERIRQSESIGEGSIPRGGIGCSRVQHLGIERARVVVDDLRLYLDARLRQVSAKSKLAEAIRYALNRWAGLTVFIEDGRVELDSNTVERSIRPLALNRKNALFAGSDEGGDNWAVIATLIENYKHASINPHTWLKAMPFQAPVL